MGKASSVNRANRAPRVKLAGTVLSLLRLENGRETRGKLHQLSITGGLLHLEKPLDEGIKVEVIFHVGSSTVRSKARMLFPLWATQGYLQPFEFSDLCEEDRCSLQADLQQLLDRSAATIVPAPPEPSELSSGCDPVKAGFNPAPAFLR
jgi:hypothetical protein